MAEDRPPGRRLQPEMLVGMSAVLIGVCALFVSLYEAKLMREEQRSAVLPLLELGRSYYLSDQPGTEDRWRLSFTAENVGIGPARVQDFLVTVDGEPQRDWRSAVQALLGSDLTVRYGQSTINGRTIPPERRVAMFDLSNTEIGTDIVRHMNSGRLDFEACFCSVFDECWTTSYSTFGAAQPAEHCERGDDSFEE